MNQYPTILFTLFVVNVLTSIAHQTTGTSFNVLNNKRSQLSVSATYNATTEAQCVIYCTLKQDCLSININGYICELLELNGERGFWFN